MRLSVLQARADQDFPNAAKSGDDAVAHRLPNATPMSDALVNQISTSVNAVSDSVRKALGSDLDALRATLDERIKAFEASITHTNAVFDHAVHEIRDIAAAEAARAADQARLEAEQAAQRNLEAARQQAQEEATAQRAGFETARAALEAQLAAARAQCADTSSALAEAQHEIGAGRRAWADQNAQLDEADRRIRALEDDHAQWTLGRQVAEAHLEEERQRRKTIAVQLETLQEELHLAKAEARSCRLEVQQLRHRLQRLEPGTVLGGTSAETPLLAGADDRGAMLENLRDGLKAVGNAATADAVLTSLLESLSEHFLAVALFAMAPGGLTRWRSLGADAARFGVISPTGDSPIARAARDRTVVLAQASVRDGLAASGDRLVRAAAIPVLASDRVIAVVYVEHPYERVNTDVALFTTLAEVLTDRVNQRLQRAPALTRVPPAPDRLLGPAPEADAPSDRESPRYVLARQARRVPIHDGVTVLLNGVASALVDLSTLGAQVVSPAVVYPNRSVRVVLPLDEGDLSCKARIVWARVDSQEDAAVRYRAGLEFTEADKATVQLFVARHGAAHMAPAPSTMH